jgi:hypothetical protein
VRRSVAERAARDQEPGAERVVMVRAERRGHGWLSR